MRICTTSGLYRYHTRRRQGHNEPCFLPESALDAYLPVMAADNLMANGQPQASPSRHTFGGKKRFKDVRQIVGRNPCTGVSDLHLDIAGRTSEPGW